MEAVLILAIAAILSLAYLAFLAVLLYELRRQNKKILDKKMENLKQCEQMLRLVKLATSESESATKSPKQVQPRDKCGRFEKSKRADDPRK